ncbi:MAG: sigma 54-interacting transcriptional regulator, partial [Deltaproteobacteria bacterium]|nr:sigma 54-interacting transcriptional regulator [Deltaproteobacteria bacterium]
MPRNEPEQALQKARPGRSLYWKVLAAFFILSVVPLGAVEIYVSAQLDSVRELADETSRTYERRAERVAHRVAGFLHHCEDLLGQLAQQPRSPEAFAAFAKQHKRAVWVRAGSNEAMVDERGEALLFKEVSFIGPDGKERIRIHRGQVVAGKGMRQVSDPAKTTYRSEVYFQEAWKAEAGKIYVSHLNGFHVNRIEQLGIEKIIAGLEHRDAEAKNLYRYLLYEMLRAAGDVEFVNSFRAEDGTMLVYRGPHQSGHILVEAPGEVSPEQLQARELELRQIVDSVAPEDVVEGRRYDGVIRFATKVLDEEGRAAGVVTLALDHLHLMQFTQHIKAMEEKATVFAGYRDADYTYLFDDEGWIITHPKFWNIRGLDASGQMVSALGPDTTSSQALVGHSPINLLKLDWKMGEGYHMVVLETRARRTGIATSINLSGVLRTRVYSPIPYSTGAYAKHGVFGGVMMGTRVDKFIGLLRQMNERVGAETRRVQRILFWPLFGGMLLVLGLAVLVAHGLMRPIRALSRAARLIGQGQLDTHIPVGRSDELGDMAQAFRDMIESLKDHIARLELSNVELKQVQGKLLQAEKEKRRELQQEVDQLQKEIARASFANMIGRSEGMRQVKEEITRVADSSATIMILGENGTGKELVAEAVHRNSNRRDRPFIKVNCAAFNENLLESELFGHLKGSFTGADKARKGVFETADGGTLLLDEVGDMSLDMQKKLLRTLQEGEVIPLGASKVVKVDVRILAATNQDLQVLMREGRFREDLYHRLQVISI